MFASWAAYDSCLRPASAGTLPIMGIAFFFMLRNWLGAVNSLSDYQVRKRCDRSLPSMVAVRQHVHNGIAC